MLTGSSLASTFLGLAGHLAATPGTSVVEVAGERLMRAYGSFPHPNIFGGYLAMAITFILVSKNKLLYHTTSTLKHSITLIILTLLTSTLVITFSRSAWLALTIGIFSFFIVSAIERKKISRKFLSGLAIVIVAFVATAALFNNAIFTRLDATDRLETKSLTERQSEYQMIGEVIKTNPFVGVGPGAYTIALAEKFPGHDVWFYQPMHNLFLLFFAETGLLGLMFFGFVVWAVVRRRDGRQFVTAIIPIVTTITTLAIFDHYLWSHWSGLVLLVVVLAIFVKVR
ncbi:MAG: O-antigen ligase-related protein [Candidatus Uhrbacteria bacterium GW2011_GWF2_44_350]|uniref:O-antigen ligase-related protein n=1 Tax=Candidatus Uhrbacteria bacterium GW2011_GWF2_44_350 TaxID=1619000 RepID=A0A0G1M8G9_9BACT|nr:MAG: O-antigen ligase-related protein [Candidatus Uhrbacteria bacterium GW2011_GWF2_44_350]